EVVELQPGDMVRIHFLGWDGRWDKSVSKTELQRDTKRVSMKSLAASTIIRATPETVWAILSDGAGWVAWNPTIEKVEGTIASGSQVKVFTKLSPGRAFPVRVSEFTPPRRMVWTGGMLLGLFKGVRTY